MGQNRIENLPELPFVKISSPHPPTAKWDFLPLTHGDAGGMAASHPLPCACPHPCPCPCLSVPGSTHVAPHPKPPSYPPRPCPVAVRCEVTVLLLLFGGARLVGPDGPVSRLQFGPPAQAQPIPGPRKREGRRGRAGAYSQGTGRCLTGRHRRKMGPLREKEGKIHINHRRRLTSDCRGTPPAAVGRTAPAIRRLPAAFSQAPRNAPSIGHATTATDPHPPVMCWLG